MSLSARRLLPLLVVLALSFSLLSACTPTQTPEPAPPVGDTAPEIDADQYLNVSLGADPATLDPSLRADTYSSSIMINTMECLVRTEERDGEPFTNRGDAKEWSANDDGTVWTFIIDGNKWEDGQPVTAYDYEFSIKRTAMPETGSPISDFLVPLKNFGPVSKGEMDVSELGVAALDEKTLQLTLTDPLPAFMNMIDFTGYYPQRQDKYEEWGDKYGSDAKYVISNGPFRLESWERNNSLVLKKNEHYFDADKVKLETINFLVMTDETTRYHAYEGEEIDFVSTEKEEWMQRFLERDDSDHISYTSANIACVFCNTKDDILQSTNIRKALSLAIDREDMNEMCFSGIRIPTYGWVVPTITVGDYNYRAAAGDMTQEMLAEITANGQTPKDLLLLGMEELGLGDDPGALKLVFSLGGTDDFTRTIGEYLQQVYKEELDLNVEIDFADWGIFLSSVFKGEYQFGFISYGAYYNDPYDVLSMFMSGTDTLCTGWVNTVFDENVAKASIEMDDEKRLQHYIAAETAMIKDDTLLAPLATASVNMFARKCVNNYPAMTFSHMGYKYAYTSGR